MHLVVTPSPDDGGLPLLGYIVFRQENWLGEYTEPVVSLLPRARHVEVTGLIPSTGYRCAPRSQNKAARAC